MTEGCFSNSCASTPKYAALKIISAEASTTSTEITVLAHLSESSQEDPNAKHITTLLDTFQHKGPNGVHQCLIFELMGASAASLVDFIPLDHAAPSREQQRYPKDVAKKILRHTLQGLCFVHKNGLVHSDVQPGNLLFAIQSVDEVAEQRLTQDESETAVPLQRLDGKFDRWAPRNVYLRQTLHEHVRLDTELCVKLSDFGAGKYFHYRANYH